MSEGHKQRWRGISWVLAASLLPIGIVRAQANGDLRLDWIAPEGCPTSSDLEASIQRLLGRPPRLNDGRELDVKASARLAPDGLWHGQVDTSLGSKLGRRILQTESCRAVADATAFIVALMIDPEAVAAHQRSPASAASSVPPTVPAPTTQSPPSRPLARQDEVGQRPPVASGRSLAIGLGAVFAADTGTLPGPTYGGGARVGVKLDHSSLEIGIVDWADSRRTIPGTSPPAGGDFHLLSGFVGVCPALAVRALDLGACVDAELDVLRGVGFGVSSTYENSFRWFSVGAGPLARLRLDRHFSVSMKLGALVPLEHPTFTLKGVSEDQGRVHRPASVVGRAALGVDLDF